MKITSLLLAMISIATISQSANAQFGGLFGRRVPKGPQSIFSPEMTAHIIRESIPLISTSETCTTSFQAGSDGVFKSTPYCHRADPTVPGTFLQQGHDVPAGFLTGYTERELLTRWEGFAPNPPSLAGKRVEVPVELLRALNVKAAQVWEKLLSCSNGDADKAREMYRLGSPECDPHVVKQLVGDIRSSLPSLAQSAEIAIFMDAEAAELRYREIQAHRSTLVPLISTDMRRYQVEYEKVRKDENDIWEIRGAHSNGNLQELLRKYVPLVPRMHPVLVQLVVEEMVSLFPPTVSIREQASQLKRNKQIRVYWSQLLVWLYSIEGRGCSSFGLWPSANRASIEAMTDRSLEIVSAMANRKFQMNRPFLSASCIPGKGEPVPDRILPRPEGIRLPDVYLNQRANIWREVIDIKSRYAQ